MTQRDFYTNSKFVGPSAPHELTGTNDVWYVYGDIGRWGVRQHMGARGLILNVFGHCEVISTI